MTISWNDLYEYKNKCKDYDNRIIYLAIKSSSLDTLKAAYKLQQIICNKCYYLNEVYRLKELYSSLNIKMQQIIKMKYCYKMRIEDIAHYLNISKRTVFRYLDSAIHLK